MRKTLLIVLAVIAVLGVGVASVNHYQKYQNKKHTEQAAVESKQVADVKQAAATEYKALQGKYDSLRIECEKGAAAYATLTPFAKSKTPAPQCGPAVIQ